MDWRTPYLDLTDDYAIVSRVSDPTTDETVVVAAGITKYGTLAAGESLTSSRIEELSKYAPSGWRRKNLASCPGHQSGSGEFRRPIFGRAAFPRKLSIFQPVLQPDPHECFADRANADCKSTPAVAIALGSDKLLLSACAAGQ